MTASKTPTVTPKTIKIMTLAEALNSRGRKWILMALRYQREQAVKNVKS